MSNKLLKFSIVMFMVTIITVMFTGCDTSKLKASCQSLRDQFESRATANKNIAEDMKNTGLISKDYLDTLNTSIDQHMDELAKKFEIPDDVDKLDFGKDGKYNTVLKSVSAFALPYPGYLGAYYGTTGHGEKDINNEDQYVHADEWPKPDGDAGSPTILTQLFFWAIVNYGDSAAGNKVVRSSLFRPTSDAKDGSYKKDGLRDDRIESVYNDPDMPSVNNVNLNWLRLKDNEVVPYEIVSDSISGTETLNDVIKSPIYVLDSTKLNASNGIDIETMMGTIQELLKPEDEGGVSNSEKVSRLTANYFKKTDKTLVENDTVTGVLIANSTGYDEMNMVGLQDKVDNNRPGKDLIITEWGYPLFTIRLKEFNKDAWEEFKEKVGLGEDSVSIIRSGNENSACVVLDYPVSTLQELATSTDGTLTGKLSNSIRDKDYGYNNYAGYTPYDNSYYMSVNIYTGKLIKNKKISKDETQKATVDNDNSYMIVAKKTEQTDSSKSSFELTKGSYKFEVQGVTQNSKPTSSTNKGDYFKKNPTKVEVPEILCKDYLEAVYAPGFNSGEDWVAFGRKLRLENYTIEVDSNSRAQLKWNLKSSSNIAGYVDINGDTVSKAKVQYNEIADLKSYRDGYAEITDDTDPTTGVQTFSEHILTDKELNVHLADYQDELTDTDKQPQNDDGTLKATKNTKIQLESSGTSNAEGIKKLDSWITNDMYVSVPFPSNYIDSADYKDAGFATRQNQLFYAIGTTKTIFENDLYTGWINKSQSDEDSEKACMDWFIGWLSDNDYNYTLEKDKLDTYLKNNYSYEFAKANDIILINPEVVAKLQDDLDEEKSLGQAKKFTSIFKIIGWGLISYSLILIVSWVLDTMVDIGIKLTNKITFGKWEAVRYESDLPAVGDTSDIKYISLPTLIKSVLVIDIVGIILIVVPALKLLAGLLGVFGKIAEYFDDMFTNIYR